MLEGLKASGRSILSRFGMDASRARPSDPVPAAPLFEPKFSTGQIDEMVGGLQRRDPHRTVWLLTDGYTTLPPSATHVIDCRRREVQLPSRATPDDLFVYGCDSDELGLPWIRAVLDLGARFYPVNAYGPSTYAHINDSARRMLESEYVTQTREGFAKWDCGPGDFLNLVQALDMTARLEGDYVEIGCYRGSSAAVAVRYMRERGLARRAYFFDTFDGFAYEEAQKSSDAFWYGTHATEGEAEIRQRIARCADRSRVEVRVERLNIIHDDLPGEIEQIAVANVDVDLYEAVKASLSKVAPRIALGGVLVVEDPGHTPALIGSRIALQEFLEEPLAGSFVPVYMESGQTLLIRRKE